MRKRPARRHRNEIGAGVDGQENAERRRVDAGADQDRARGAAPEPRADAEGEKHRGDCGVQTGAGLGELREGGQKSVGAPPSALRRAPKAVSASKRSAWSGGATKSRKRSATMRSAASTAVGEPASRQVS